MMEMEQLFGHVIGVDDIVREQVLMDDNDDDDDGASPNASGCYLYARLHAGSKIKKELLMVSRVPER